MLHIYQTLCSVSCSWIVFNSYFSCIQSALFLCSLYQWGNCYSERKNNLLELALGASGMFVIWTKFYPIIKYPCLSESSFLHFYFILYILKHNFRIIGVGNTCTWNKIFKKCTKGCKVKISFFLYSSPLCFFSWCNYCYHFMI